MSNKMENVTCERFFSYKSHSPFYIVNPKAVMR